MVRSYRGKEVNMLALAKRNEYKTAIGNAHMNTRGDILGKGGVIIKTREEQIKEYEESIKLQEGEVSLKGNQISDLERDLKKYVSKPEKIIPKKQEKKKEEIKEEEIKEEEIIFDEEE